MERQLLASGNVEVGLFSGANVELFDCRVFKVAQKNADGCILFATVPAEYWDYNDKSSRMVKGSYSFRIRYYSEM